jgi:hypothetical protein
MNANDGADLNKMEHEVKIVLKWVQLCNLYSKKSTSNRTRKTDEKGNSSSKDQNQRITHEYRCEDGLLLKRRNKDAIDAPESFGILWESVLSHHRIEKQDRLQTSAKAKGVQFVYCKRIISFCTMKMTSTRLCRNPREEQIGRLHPPSPAWRDKFWALDV